MSLVKKLLGWTAAAVIGLSSCGSGNYSLQQQSKIDSKKDIVLEQRIEHFEEVLNNKLKSLSEQPISGPPIGEMNKVDDLTIERPEGTDKWHVSWSYQNSGDYDQNSEVNIADITPLALYFQQSVEDSNSLVGIVDGDRNGEINMADITPIVINFNSNVSEYSLQGAEWLYKPFSEITRIPFADSENEARKEFSLEMNIPDYEKYRVFKVVPIDDQGNEGIESIEVGPLLGRMYEIKEDPEPEPGIVAGLPNEEQIITNNQDVERLENIIEGNENVPSIPITNQKSYEWKLHELPVSGTPGFVSAQVINGRPTVIYITKEGSLHYIRSSKVTPTENSDWRSHIVLGADDSISDPKLKEFNGKAVMAYSYDGTTFYAFAKVDEPDGLTDWRRTIVNSTGGLVGTVEDLEIINGFPAICYRSGDANVVRYSWAEMEEPLAPDHWTSTTFDSDVLGNLSLTQVNDKPVVSYVKESVLRFARANVSMPETIEDWVLMDVLTNSTVDSYVSEGNNLWENKPFIGYIESFGHDWKVMLSISDVVEPNQGDGWENLTVSRKEAGPEALYGWGEAEILSEGAGGPSVVSKVYPKTTPFPYLRFAQIDPYSFDDNWVSSEIGSVGNVKDCDLLEVDGAPTVVYTTREPNKVIFGILSEE